MIIPRPLYLEKLISLRGNGLIKIVTGIRRCGKSFLLFEIFSDWLKNHGVREDHLIKIDLEDRRNAEFRDPDFLIKYIDSKIDDSETYYVLIDEIQLVNEFEDVLNSYLKIENVEIYVTGSNAKFLSHDVKTIFRGRSFEIRVYPLSFSEYFNSVKDTGISIERAYDNYSLFGGLPQVLLLNDDRLKSLYLKDLLEETYLKDIIDRFDIRYPEELESILKFIASSIGSLTNPQKITDTLSSVAHSNISRPTTVKYLDYLSNAFLIEKALRYDLKGKKYFDTHYKFYFTDMGLRNSCLNFRQVEPSHIMENVIYNELLIRGYNVDVGVVPVMERNSEGKLERKSLEIDFVCNQGSRRYYIQSALRMESSEKIYQEERSLSKINDSFKKIIIVGNEINVRHTDKGTTLLSLYEFLLNPNSLDL